MLIEFIKPDFTHTDEKGSLVELVHKGWSQVNYITANVGTVRGNHYHKENDEAFFIISGKIKLTLETLDKSIQEIYELGANDFFKVNNGIIHILEFLEPTALIALYDKGVGLPGGAKDVMQL